MATQAGIDLIDTIKDELLKSAKLTGIWENKLRQIERGTYSPGAFIGEISALVHQVVTTVLADNSSTRIVAPEAESKIPEKTTSEPKAKRAPRIKSIEEIKCPICGEGHLVKGRTAYGCNRFAYGCSYRLPFEICPADATPAQVRKAATKKK